MVNLHHTDRAWGIIGLLPGPIRLIRVTCQWSKLRLRHWPGRLESWQLDQNLNCEDNKGEFGPASESAFCPSPFAPVDSESLSILVANLKASMPAWVRERQPESRGDIDRVVTWPPACPRQGSKNEPFPGSAREPAGAVCCLHRRSRFKASFLTWKCHGGQSGFSAPSPRDSSSLPVVSPAPVSQTAEKFAGKI